MLYRKLGTAVHLQDKPIPRLVKKLRMLQRALGRPKSLSPVPAGIMVAVLVKHLYLLLPQLQGFVASIG